MIFEFGQWYNFKFQKQPSIPKYMNFRWSLLRILSDVSLKNLLISIHYIWFKDVIKFVENFIASIDLSSFSFLDENGILLSQELLFCKQGVLHGYHLSWGIGSNDVNTLVFRINVAPLLLLWRKSLQKHVLREHSRQMVLEYFWPTYLL